MAAPAVPSDRPVLRGLSLTYPAQPRLFNQPQSPRPALTEVSFALFEGKNVGIVGEGGSGKTTLGNGLMRVLRPDAGSMHRTARGGATPRWTWRRWTGGGCLGSTGRSGWCSRIRSLP